MSWNALCRQLNKPLNQQHLKLLRRCSCLLRWFFFGFFLWSCFSQYRKIIRQCLGFCRVNSLSIRPFFSGNFYLLFCMHFCLCEGKSKRSASKSWKPFIEPQTTSHYILLLGHYWRWCFHLSNAPLYNSWSDLVHFMLSHAFHLASALHSCSFPMIFKFGEQKEVWGTRSLICLQVHRLHLTQSMHLC